MENDIPKLIQEKIWGLVSSHHSGSFLLSDRCAFQGTTFIIAGAEVAKLRLQNSELFAGYNVTVSISYLNTPESTGLLS